MQRSMFVQTGLTNLFGDSSTQSRLPLLSILLIVLSLSQHSIKTVTAFGIMPSSPGQVVVVGSANQDLTSYTNTLPVMGETVMGDTFATSCGGKGANQAVAAASLSLSPVTMVCRVGADIFGQSLLDKFRRAGVKYDKEMTIIKDNDDDDNGTPTSSGVASIVVDKKSGNNMIIVSPGANYKLTPDQVDSQLRNLPEKPAVLLVQLEIRTETALQALKTAKELGSITILNPAPAPSSEEIQQYLPFTDILIPNESELRKLCGKAEDADDVNEEELAKLLLEKGVGKAMIVTLGARGAMIMEKSGNVAYACAPENLPCNKEPVVDTIGAGDAFCGALASYMSSALDGMSLEQATTMACGYASMSVRRKGTDYPTYDDLPDCLKVAAHDSHQKEQPQITLISSSGKIKKDGNTELHAVMQKMLNGAELPFVLSSQNIELPDALHGSPQDIIKEKCLNAVKLTNGPVICEETLLEFNALKGLPGLYTNQFIEKCGIDVLPKLLAAYDDKSAVARTVLAFASSPNDKVQLFEGVVEGTIVDAPQDNTNGDTLSWDAIFAPKVGNGQTYAEMSEYDCEKISHRGKAFEQLKEYLGSTAKVPEPQAVG